MTTTYGPYVIERRVNDWKAYMIGDSRVWEAGKTAHEALGRLVITVYSAMDEDERAVLGVLS